MGRSFALLACVALAAGLAGRAAAAPDESLATRGRAYSLRQCLDLAELNYPKVAEARARSGRMRGELWEARTAPYSEFKSTAGFGLAPTVRGTSVYSPNSDVALTESMAFAWRVGIEGVVPLWTFGKTTSLVDAASAQVRVGEQGVLKAKNEVKLSVREAYWGLQLARDGLALVREAMGKFREHIEKLDQALAKGDGDDIPLIKARIYYAELEARESEALQHESRALAGLRFLTGAPDVDAGDEALGRAPHRLGPLVRYLAAARVHRPEINMARAGVLAREAQVRLSRAKLFPDLGLGLAAKWAAAPEIDDQRNPFVRDESNSLWYGAALVLQWKLDFLPQAARIAQAEAELEEMRATERYALGGIGVEVENAFAEARDAERRLDAYSRASQLAKQWLVKVRQGIDVGTYEDEDVVNPSKEYAQKRFAVMSATFDYNMALARLALATGWDGIE